MNLLLCQSFLWLNSNSFFHNNAFQLYDNNFQIITKCFCDFEKTL